MPAGCVSPAAQDVACWSVLASTAVRLNQAADLLSHQLRCVCLCATACLPAAVCAMMSTADSALLAFSSMWVKDLFVPYIRPQATQQQQIWFGRAMSVVGLSIGVALGEWAAGTEEGDGCTAITEQAKLARALSSCHDNKCVYFHPDVLSNQPLQCSAALRAARCAEAVVSCVHVASCRPADD